MELNWQKSFGNLGGYLPVNTLQLKPTLSAALPAWFFVSVQDKTSWSIENQNVGSLLKITAGRFLTAGKTVVLAAEYETPLDPVAAQRPPLARCARTSSTWIAARLLRSCPMPKRTSCDRTSLTLDSKAAAPCRVPRLRRLSRTVHGIAQSLRRCRKSPPR